MSNPDKAQEIAENNRINMEKPKLKTSDRYVHIDHEHVLKLVQTALAMSNEQNTIITREKAMKHLIDIEYASRFN